MSTETLLPSVRLPDLPVIQMPHCKNIPIHLIPEIIQDHIFKFSDKIDDLMSRWFNLIQSSTIETPEQKLIRCQEYCRIVKKTICMGRESFYLVDSNYINSVTSSPEMRKLFTDITQEFETLHLNWSSQMIFLYREFFENHPIFNCSRSTLEELEAFMKKLVLPNLINFTLFLDVHELREDEGHQIWEPLYIQNDGGIVSFIKNSDRIESIIIIPMEEWFESLRLMENTNIDGDFDDYGDGDGGDGGDGGEEAELENVSVTIPYKNYMNFITRIKVTRKNRASIPEKCCICLEPFKGTVDKTKCNHYFHARCLRKQLCTIGPPRCPMCRFDVRDEG